MYITQEQYLENANRKLKEWFKDNTYDISFIPLVAKDYLTAYLMKFQNLDKEEPDLDWVLDKLFLFNETCVEKFKPLNIKDEIKDLDYYINLLYQCKEYIEKRIVLI